MGNNIDETVVVIGFLLTELERSRDALREIRTKVYEIDPELSNNAHHQIRDLVDAGLTVRYP